MPDRADGLLRDAARQLTSGGDDVAEALLAALPGSAAVMASVVLLEPDALELSWRTIGADRCTLRAAAVDLGAWALWVANPPVRPA